MSPVCDGGVRTDNTGRAWASSKYCRGASTSGRGNEFVGAKRETWSTSRNVSSPTTHYAVDTESFFFLAEIEMFSSLLGSYTRRPETRGVKVAQCQPSVWEAKSGSRQS